VDVKAIRAIANAILYEGYMLYPYRPSALKNRSQGWTFGTLLPEQYASAHPGEPDGFESQLLITGGEAQLSAEVRFLQLCGPEPLERSVAVGPLSVSDLLSRAALKQFALPESHEQVGCVPLQGMVRIFAATVADTAVRLTIAVRNESSPGVAWDCRDSALKQALVSAHALLTVQNGEFVSLLSPPVELGAAAAACRQVGVFPVLAGEEGARTAMLISPVILYDYPQVAATSRGDFFDSTEIDEMLTLRVLTLTDAEKEEVRATNARARELLQRTESLKPEEILKLHGVIRDASHSGGRS
jgi:hypothetical protein